MTKIQILATFSRYEDLLGKYKTNYPQLASRQNDLRLTLKTICQTSDILVYPIRLSNVFMYTNNYKHCTLVDGIYILKQQLMNQKINFVILKKLIQLILKQTCVFKTFFWTLRQIFALWAHKQTHRKYDEPYLFSLSN